MPNLIVAGISDRGDVVGGVSVTTSGAITRTDGDAIVWRHSKVVSLGSLPNLGDAVATAINSRGQIVGNSSSASVMEFQDTPTGVTHAFLWDQGKMTDLGEGAAAAISDAGQIVGTLSFTEARSNGYTSATHAALWDRGKRRDLGSLPEWTFSAATAINAQGAVVGDCYNGMEQEPSEAFLWRAGRMRDLGPGRALAIAGGQIVGVSGGRAVLWQRGGLCDLNSCLRGAPGWVLTSADGINDRGQIVGVGTRHGQSRAFLLTPSLPRLSRTVTVPQTAQMHLIAAATGGDKIILYWKGIPGAARYNVYRSLASASAARRVNRAPVQTHDPGILNGWTYTDRGLKNDVSYVYTVAAVSSRGQEIARSNPSQAAPNSETPPWNSRNAAKIAAQIWKNAQGVDMPDDDFGPTLPPSPQDFVAPDGIVYKDPGVYIPPSPYRYDAHPAIAYDAVEVGGLSRVFGQSLSLNAGGAVTGSIQPPPGDTRPALPFVWQNGAMHMLPLPPSESPYGFTSGINAVGTVCGRGNTLGRRQAALLWSGGVVRVLPPLPGGEHCAAYGIGDGGQIVGESAGTTGRSHMVVWDPDGLIHDMGLGRLTGINAAGQVVGTQSGTLTRRDHAVLGQNGVLRDLGTLGGPFSTGAAINSQVDVAGWSNVAHGSTHGFLYTAGRMINLGLPPDGVSSHANALNNADVVVGSAATQTGRIALIWRQGTLANLDALTALPPGVTLIDATAINDRGQICAVGRIGNTIHAYLLTPRTAPPPVKQP